LQELILPKAKELTQIKKLDIAHIFNQPIALVAIIMTYYPTVTI
jgi:hypothetical protein